MVQLLVDKGVDIAAADSDGRTALYHATVQGDTVMVRLLIDKGADISGVDSNGRTVLHHAVRGRNQAMVKLLIEKGHREGSRYLSPG